MRLELFQLLERIRLGLLDDLIRLRLRVLHNLGGVPFRTAQHLVLGGSLLGALVGARHDARRLSVRFRDDALLLRDRPVGLLDLVRQIEPDLIDKLHRLILIEHDLVRKRNVARVVHQLLEVVKQLVDLYLYFSFSALATAGGTRSDTFPPYLAMSFKILDET